MDVGPDEDTGIAVLDINNLAEDKTTKSDASIRKIPIHPDLLALGLLDRVEARKAAGETRLFPGNLLTQNGPAASTSKAFQVALKAWGIAPRGKKRWGFTRSAPPSSRKWKAYPRAGVSDMSATT